MLYTKAIQEIEWDDIVNFCEQKIPEGATLDYKQDFPNKLEKLIAAFANTLGGLILIGVEEDEESKPKLPLKGIKFEKGLEERVTNIILTNITPPIFPEITVCTKEIEGEKRAILVIRVPQSHMTPHAINNNRRVYIRAGNRNSSGDYEDLATLEQLFWMAEGRKKSEELRDAIIKRIDDRFNFKMRQWEYLTGEEAWIKLVMASKYPKEMKKKPPEIKNALMLQSVKRITQDGLVIIDSYEKSFDYTEYNSLGVFYRKLNITVKQDKLYNNYDLKELICLINKYMISAKEFFNLIKERGILTFNVIIDGMMGKKMVTTYDAEHESIDPIITHSEDFIANKLDDEEERLSIIFNAVQRIAWSFDTSITREYVQDVIKNCRE